MNEEFNPMFLLAVPQLGDPNFAKSVVLILHQGGTGALGLIVNSPLPVTLGQLAQDSNEPCHADLALEPVLRGGPVEEEKGWILHADDSMQEKREVMSGLYVSGSQETLYTLLEKGQKPMRLVLGYAGWDAGQLQEEMVQGSWITARADTKYIFSTPPEKMWNKILSDMGVDPTRLMMGGGFH